MSDNADYDKYDLLLDPLLLDPNPTCELCDAKNKRLAELELQTSELELALDACTCNLKIKGSHE